MYLITRKSPLNVGCHPDANRIYTLAEVKLYVTCAYCSPSTHHNCRSTLSLVPQKIARKNGKIAQNSQTGKLR